MRNRVLVMVCCVVLVSMPVLAQKVEEPQDLKMLQRLPKDPLLACAFELGNGGELFDTIIGKIRELVPDEAEVELDAALAEMREELGLSLRDDLLAHIGPEVAFVLDMPPIDTAFAAVTASGPASVPTVLGDIGLWIDVVDAKALDKSIRHLLGMGELTITDEQGLVKVTAIPGGDDEPPLDIYYKIDKGVLAAGFDPVRVQAMTGKVDKTEQLAAGEDFGEVLSHLDGGASALFYLNLPKVQSMLNESQFIQGMIQSDEEMKPVAQLLANPDIAPCGLGVSTVQMGKGARRVSYGPAWMSTGAGTLGIIAGIAVPNFIAAVDRGRQKRTMSDMRTLGTAIEAYGVDHAKYPGPTEGFVEIEVIADKIEGPYIKTAPREDGWGNQLLYWSDEKDYRIISPGEDGEYSQDWLGEIEAHSTSTFSSDIVYGNGVFMVWPEGIQS
jgi:type II secretory pathway pseudopilin PulG